MITQLDNSQACGNTQYNKIADAYTSLYKTDGEEREDVPLNALEIHQFRVALHDPKIDVRGKRVLDIACGNGHNTHRYLAWGAESVTGMEISDGMLEVAKQDALDRGLPESKAQYFLGDASDPDIVLPGAPFDIVTSSWLLNYARDTEMMTRMWKTIGRHLKPGCITLCLTIPPLLTDQVWEAEMLAHAMGPDGVWGRHGNTGAVLYPMPNGDGYKTRIDLNLAAVEGEEIPSFENYHLHMRVFQDSIMASGMFDSLEWREFYIPEELKARYPPGFWNDSALWPHCRVAMARRSMK